MKIAKLLAATALSLCVLAPHVAQAKGAFVDLTVDEAIKKAKETKKLVFIDFFTTWCGPCKKLDRQTWPDPAVQTFLSEKTIALKIDADKQRAVARKYGVRSYPTLMYLNGDGKVVNRSSGFRDAKRFVSEGEDVVLGRTPVDRARADLKGKEKDPVLRLALARALVKEQAYSEALDEYLWLFDHGAEHSRSFLGARSGFVLKELKQLSRRFPPTRYALMERRDMCDLRVRDTPTRQEVTDLEAMNRELSEPWRTIMLYDELPTEHAARAYLWESVAPALIEEQRYDEYLAGLGDADGWADRAFAKFEPTIGQTSGARRVRVSSAERRRLQQQTLAVHEALLALGREDEAATLAVRLLALPGFASLRPALAGSADRAGARDVADGFRKAG